jgi:hypothetical protein
LTYGLNQKLGKDIQNNILEASFMMSPLPVSLMYPDGVQYNDEKAHLQIFDSGKFGSDSGSQTDVSDEHSKNVTRWPSTENLQRALAPAEGFAEPNRLHSAASLNPRNENAFVVEALIASEVSEKIVQFCTDQDITPNESLLLAFHAFYVRTTDEEGEQVYTMHGRHDVHHSLSLTSDLPANFSLLVQEMKLASTEPIDSSRKPPSSDTRYESNFNIFMHSLTPFKKP